MTGILAAMAGSGGIVPQVSLFGGFFEDVDSPTALSGVEVQNNGKLYQLRFSQPPSDIEDWVLPSNLAANYEVRATWVSGASPSGAALGTWLDCAINRAWYIQTTTFSTSEIALEIRDKATQTIRASGTYYLQAEALGGF